MFLRVISILALLVGGLLSAFGWGSYQLNLATAVSSSAVPISQLANQATVDILGGMGLMVFGLALGALTLLGEIRDNLSDLVEFGAGHDSNNLGAQ